MKRFRDKKGEEEEGRRKIPHAEERIFGHCTYCTYLLYELLLCTYIHTSIYIFSINNLDRNRIYSSTLFLRYKSTLEVISVISQCCHSTTLQGKVW